LLAARKNKRRSKWRISKKPKQVMMGVERKSLHISDRERKLTAYHESGHVLVAVNIRKPTRYTKSLSCRWKGARITHQLPMDERITIRVRISPVTEHPAGGRAAEKIIFNELTTGAGNDIERATELARKMVCEWGMSEKLGPLTFGKKTREIFLGGKLPRIAISARRPPV
jgi:cell division protease FtsH